MKQDNRLWKNPNCNIREFQLVINLLYEKKAPIEWFFPPIGKVATFALRNHKAKIIPRKEYDAKLRNFISKNPGCRSDIPTYYQFMEAFFCAGLPPLTKAENFLKSPAQSRNTFHGGKPLWVGYDTSVLRRSFHSNIIDFLKLHKLDNSIGHVVAGGVTEELMQGMDYKYKFQKVAELAADFPQASNFLNQPSLSARLHRIGMAEIKNMKENYVFHEAPSEKDDLEIIKGYEKFEGDRNAEIVLFSSDKNFVEMAVQKSLKTQYVEYSVRKLQNHLKNNPIPLDFVSRIIYYGTMVFGMTRLGGVELYSIWQGKKVEDWNRGHIKVKIKGNLAKPFKEAHGVLEDMKKSGFLPNS